MALHTKKDFAELCNLPPKNLATYIGRKKVNVRQDGMIDDKDQMNKAFLALRKSKASEKQVVSHVAKYPTVNLVDDEEELSDESPEDEARGFMNAMKVIRELREKDKEGEVESAEHGVVPSFERSATLLKFLDTKKREREIQLLRLREEKLKGQMVPSELIQPVILQHNQSMITEFKNAGDNFLRVFSQKKSLSGEEMAEVKGEFTRIINEAVTRATEMSIKSIEAIINNFAETRTKGERK